MQINPSIVIGKKMLIPNEFTKPQQNGIDCTISEEVILPPKSFKNILLNEKVNIEPDYLATTNIRSSYSRKGIFSSSGIYDAGYKGGVGCSLYNLSDETIVIPKNERVIQIIFWQGESNFLYNGYYNHTDSIESKIKEGAGTA